MRRYPSVTQANPSIILHHVQLQLSTRPFRYSSYHRNPATSHGLLSANLGLQKPSTFTWQSNIFSQIFIYRTQMLFLPHIIRALFYLRLFRFFLSQKPRVNHHHFLIFFPCRQRSSLLDIFLDVGRQPAFKRRERRNQPINQQIPFDHFQPADRFKLGTTLVDATGLADPRCNFCM